MRPFLINLCLLISSCVFAQPSGEIRPHDASNPALVYSRVVVDVESDLFENETIFYGLKPAFYYGLKSELHQLGITVPFYHNVFNGNYGGYENTSGLGDLKMVYLAVPYIKRGALGFERLSTYLELSAPTGEERLGRGTGVWMYKPGAIFAFHASPEVSFYPEVRYQFSTESANSLAGGDGTSDPEDPDDDGKIQTLTLELPAVVVLEQWDGWFALHAQYIRSFSEKTNFFFMRVDLGKMIGKRTSGALNIQKFIAGQPRLDLVLQARFQFFLK